MNSILGLKLALRALGKRPAFTAVVIFTFAIVTSTSIMVYTYIDALLFSPLPFKEADRLVRIHSMKGDEQGLLSHPEFLDMQKELTTIEELAVYRDGGRYNLSSEGKPPEELTTTFASSNLFKVLGVETQLGSYWPETLDKRGSHTVMLTDEFWKRRYDGNPNVEGLEVTLDGFTYLNYGVMPEGFSFPVRNEAFRAMAFADFVVTARDYRPCFGLARLKPGVSLAQFNEELAAFGASYEARHQESNLGITFLAEPLSNIFIGELRSYLLLIGGAILFLLAIAIVNVANLFVSQAIRRSRETTVRKILGSTSLQIIQGFVLHAFLLALIGSSIGLLLAWYFMDVSYELVSPFLPYWTVIDVNWSVILYSLGLAIALGVSTGAIPWLFHRKRGNTSEGLKEGQHSVGSGRQHTIQKGLATAQIAVSVLLLIGGMLLFKSFNAAQQADLGFDTNQKLTFRIALSWYKYGGPEKKRIFFERSLRELEAIPGVHQVAINTMLPLTDIVDTSPQSQALFSVEGQSEVEIAENPFVSIQKVTPNYFDVMDINIEHGRPLDNVNQSANQYQVVIDRQLAEKMWPGEHALGKRIKLDGLGGDDPPYLTVVGIAADVKHQSIMQDNIPSVYVSLLSYPTTDGYYVVDTSLPLAQLEDKLSSTILDIDENQPTFEYMQMADRIDLENWQSKVSSTLFLIVAIIGCVIAAVGLFSAITFILALRVKELALRKVLGATDSGIVLLILQDILKISGIGIAIGLILSPILLKPISPFLYEVQLVDLAVYLIVAFALLTISLIAAIGPSWRALFINPITALRSD